MAGPINGGSLVITGNGTTVFTNASALAFLTIQSGGSLQIGNGGTSGTIGSGTNLSNNGALIFNRSDSLTVSNVFSGSGTIKVASGTLIYAGTSNDTGLLTIAPGATLQLGNGATGGTLISLESISNNSTLAYNRSDNLTVDNVISGTGSLVQAGAGTLTLEVNSSYTGGTTITAGTLQVGSGGTAGSIQGNVRDNAKLVFNKSANSFYNITISGSGSLTQAGSGTAILVTDNTYTGGTTISAGTLQIGSSGTGNTFSRGSIVGDVVDNAALVFQRTDNLTFGGNISGSGRLQQSGHVLSGSDLANNPNFDAGPGTLTLTGTNTYTGGTTITSGTLQIGNGGTTGSLTSDIAVGGTPAPSPSGIVPGGTLSGTSTPASGAVLVFNRSDNLTFSNAISSLIPGTGVTSGAITKLGTGTLTLSGTSSFSGTTTIGAGTLNVTGAIASSAVTVQSGATLTGTGKVGAATVASGGTLTPGSSTTPGTLSVTGNLTLASGANYADAVTPTAAGLTSVSGAASINGNAIASFASGTYASGQRYTLLAATGGVSGTFASLSAPGIPDYVKGRLSYDANDVYLNLDANALSPSLPSGTSAGQAGVAAAIDTSIQSGGTPSTGISALFGLSGTALTSALSQAPGSIGANVSSAVGQGFLSFLSMIGQGGGDSGSFAPGSAYGAADAPHRAQLGAGETRVWGAAYGGHAGLSANASGGASLSSSNVGMIGGADMQVDDGLLAGVTLGIGRQNFHSGNGTGSSDDFMIGAYARKDVGPAYVAAAFGYGWHQIKTLRLVTVSGTDVLQGKENADDFGGRIEAGWRMALDAQYALSPYIAVAAGSFQSPAYAETALSGASTFALSVAAHDTTLGRSELGARLARNYETDNGSLAAELHAAWAHELDDQPFTQASFQGLPGASFTVTGVRPASDSALLGADLHMQNRSGLFFGVRGETQLGAGTTIVEGMGDLGWRW